MYEYVVKMHLMEPKYVESHEHICSKLNIFCITYDKKKKHIFAVYRRKTAYLSRQCISAKTNVFIGIPIVVYS